MKKDKFIFVLILIIMFACNSEKRALQKAKKQALLDMRNETKRQNDSLANIKYNITNTEFNRGKYENKYLDSLRMNLSEKKVPFFLYEECLDNRSAVYFVLNSETKISLRYNLIQRMRIQDIKEIILLSDSMKLKKICLNPKEDMQYANKTTWELLNIKLLQSDTLK